MLITDVFVTHFKEVWRTNIEQLLVVRLENRLVTYYTDNEPIKWIVHRAEAIAQEYYSEY